MPTPITEKEWKELKQGDKIIDGANHCWTVTGRDPVDPNKILVRLKGYENSEPLELTKEKIFCAGSEVEELNHPDTRIVTNPSPIPT